MALIFHDGVRVIQVVDSDNSVHASKKHPLVDVVNIHPQTGITCREAHSAARGALIKGGSHMGHLAITCAAHGARHRIAMVGGERHRTLEIMQLGVDA